MHAVSQFGTLYRVCLLKKEKKKKKELLRRWDWGISKARDLSGVDDGPRGVLKLSLHISYIPARQYGRQSRH